MAGGNNVEVHINGDEDVSAAAAKAAAAIDSLKDKKITVEVNVDDKKAKKALENIDKKVKEIGNGVGDFDLNTRKARDKLTYLHERAKALGDLDTEIDVDTRKARDKLTYLHNRHKEIGENKPELDFDTSKARDKLSYLKSRFSEIFSEKPEVDINTKKARDKLSKLGSRLKEVTNVKQEIDVDTEKARAKLLDLNSIGKEIESIKIDVDIEDAIEDIEDLTLLLNSIRDKTINIDVDSAGALAQISAIDSALHGIDRRKQVEVDVDVNDVDMQRWQSELDALNRNKRRLENNPYDLTIPADVEVDDKRIKELEKRIADKQNTIKVKTELDNSELEDAGIKDKKVKIDVEINGLERLVALRAVIASLEDKTININVNSDSKGIDKLTNSRNGVTRPIIQIVDVEVDNRALEAANREIRRKFAERNAKGQSFLDAEIRAAKDNFDKLLRASKNIKIRLDDDGELARLQKNFDKVTIKIATAMDREQLLRDLKNNKKILEEIPIKIRTQDDNNSLRNINKDIKNLQKIKKISIPIETRLQEADKIAKDIDRIFDTRDAAYRGTKIKADADVSAASAKLAALTRPREVDIRVNESRFERITRYFNDIGESALNSGRRINRAFNDDNNGFTRTLRGVGRLSDGVNKGIGSMTSRIPLVGSLFNALGSLGGQAGSLTTKLSSMAGMGTKTAGAMGAVVQSVISVSSAMVGLGIIGTVGTGLITAGAYAATAALGTVAGVAGAVGAAIGGGAIAGFAMLVKDAPIVQEAYSKLGTTVGDTMKRLAQPVTIPIAEAAPKLQAAFDQVSPSISKIASQTGGLIKTLGDQLPAVAKEAGPALEKAFGFGESSLKTLMSNMPAITKSVGEFFGKLDGPEVRKAVDGAFAAIPKIIGGIGTGIEKASAGFNNLQEFMGSDRLEPMREGFEKFSQSLAGTDWSSASNGIATAMNSFGTFAGEFDMQNISDGIGSFANGLATLTDIGTSMNLDGLFSGLGTAFSGFATVAEAAGKVVGGALTPIIEPIKAGFAGLDWIKDSLFGGDDPISVDGPSIELNPNISVKDQEKSDLAKDILANVDGKSFGSADAAERIISSLNNDIEKLEVKPEVKGILDQNTIAKNVNSENIGKLLQNRIGQGEENAVKIPIQTAMDIETAAGKDGLNVQDSIKDQLSKLTGIAVEDLNIEVGVGTTFKVAKNADGSLGDLIKGTIDGQGNLQIEVVATANVVAQIGGITGLDGAALDSFLGGVFDGQTISQELAVQIKANMGLANASMGDFEAALEGQLAGINGKTYDVQLNADGTLKIVVATPEAPEIPPIPAPTIPPITAEVAVQVAAAMGKETPQEMNGLLDELKSLGAQGGESIEITKEMQVNLEAVVGGGSEAEVQGKIKELISKMTGIAVEDLDITFDVNGKPQFNLLGNPAAEIANAVKSSAASAEPAKTTVTPQIDVQPQVNMNGLEASKGIVQGLQKQFGGEGSSIKVTPQVDVSGISQQLGAISVPPIKVLVQPDLTGFAAIMGAIGGSSVGIVKVLVQPDLSGFGAILGAINGSTIGTVKVLVIPDLSAMGALGAIAIPPIRVPMLIDPPIVPQIAVPMLRGTITYDAIIPPINIPNTSSTHTIVINNPGLPSFPNTTSTHTIIMNVPAMPSFPNTSSTHTINVVVNGSTSIGGGGGSARAGALAANPLARGIAPMSMGSIGAMGASGISSGGRGVQAIRQTGVDIANSFADGLESGIGAVEKAANELGQAAGQIGPQVDKYLSANSPEYSEAKRIGGEVVSNISQGITNAQGEIGKAMAGVNKFISDPLGEIDKALSANIPGYDVAKQQAQEFVTGVETTMSGLSEAAKVGADGFQKIIAEEFVLPPMDQLEAKAREIGDGIGAALMGDPSKLAGTMDGIGAAISTKLGTVASRVGEVMDQVNTTMRDKVPGFAESQDKAVQFGNGLVAGVDNARQQMNAQLTSVGLPTIPTPQMALAGVQAEVTKVQTAFGTALNAMRVETPKPVVPAPDINPVKQALANIPGAVETVNRVESDIKQAKANIDSIPEVVQTKQTIDANIGAVVAQIKSLAGMDTSSTHTVNLQMGGSSSGTGAGGSRSSMGAAIVNPLSRTAAMPMGASFGLSGSTKTGFIYDAGLSVASQFANGIIEGQSLVEAAVGSMFGKINSYEKTGNNIGSAISKGIKNNKMDISIDSFKNQSSLLTKPNYEKFYSEPASNVTYQTVNNHFDGGLVGDPESQAKRVLDVLEQAPNGRRLRKQGEL